jgi:hypothetical protein
MAVKGKQRDSQWLLASEFKFNFDDTMLNVDGVSKDFGLLNTVESAFDIIGLPPGSVITGGSLTVETAFDAATFAVIIGDSLDPDRYLTTADRKALGYTPLVPTGYRNVGALPIRMTVTAADVLTTGVATVRVEYVVADRANEIVHV